MSKLPFGKEGSGPGPAAVFVISHVCIVCIQSLVWVISVTLDCDWLLQY